MKTDARASGQSFAPAWARDHFLSSGEITSCVRDVVRNSWLRSASTGVDPGDLAPRFRDDTTDPFVLECVDEVVPRMLHHLGDEPISIIFTSPTGLVLRRFCTDTSLGQAMGRVSLVPGAEYSETSVGTNGIGTALEQDMPVLIMGKEHFSDELTVFACAGAPVRHPVSRSMVGLVDLTCDAARGGMLLLSFAKTLAAEIESALMRRVGASQLALLRDYLVASRHATGPVLALGSDLVIMNRHAQQSLPSPDRAVLLARTSDVTGVTPRTLVADLPSGATARLDYRPAFHGEELAGGIFRVAVQNGERPRRREREAVSGWAPGVSPRLPGLAGSSASWQRTCAQVREACLSRRWVVLDGESGVGKSALVRATHYAEAPERHFRVVDAADAAADPEAWLEEVEEELAGAPGTLVLRHLHLLPGDLAGPLSQVLLEHSSHYSSDDGHWVVATRDLDAPNPEIDAQIIPIFDTSHVVEPLRHRSEDVRVIAPVLARQLSRGEDLVFAGRALNQLQRHPWPGNVAQLADVVRKIVTAKRRGVVTLDDLPAECMSVGRRTLSPLEALERDAIATALRVHEGNKRQAAAQLGMSRATIYRKIRDYSITTDR